eukprot:SM000185S04027  [mRNA]  locus=s185:29832:33068:- [translate_table: standard]
MWVSAGRRRRRALLLLVPLAWGTYGPALRFAYGLPVAPRPASLTLARKAISVAVLLLLLPVERSAPPLPKPAQVDNHHGACPADAGAARQPIVAGVWGPAAELGLWTFLGTALQLCGSLSAAAGPLRVAAVLRRQAWGLESTSATAAGVAIQTTTVIVPVLASLLPPPRPPSGSDGPQLGADNNQHARRHSRPAISLRSWAAAATATAGVSVMALAGSDDAAGASLPPADLSGIPAILGAAFFYALGTVRLGTHARAAPPVALTSASTAIGLGLAASWAAADLAALARDGQDLSVVWEAWHEPMLLGTAAFSAIVPGALASLAQAAGQRAVPATEAQVFYSMQPLWSALFGAVLLGDRLSPAGWAGGAAVIGAALLTGAPDNNEECQQLPDEEGAGLYVATKESVRRLSISDGCAAVKNSTEVPR